MFGAGGVIVWDVSTGNMVSSLEGTGQVPVTSLSVARCEHANASVPYVIMAGDTDGTLRVWEGVQRREGTGMDPTLGQHHGNAAAASPSSPSSMVGNQSGNQSKNQSGNLRENLRENRNHPESLRFQRRSQFLQAHVGRVNATAIAQWQQPVRLVVSGGDDWTIRLWETVLPGSNNTRTTTTTTTTTNSNSDTKQGDSYGGWSKILRGHTGPITDIALDLCKVTSCSLDGTIKIWGTVGKNAGNCIRTLSHPFSGARNIPVRCIAVSSLRIVAGYEDGTLLLYTFHKKDNYGGYHKHKRKKKITNAWRKGGHSPQAKRHPKNTSKGSNRKYASGGTRRSMRDLQSTVTKNVSLFFDFEDL